MTSSPFPVACWAEAVKLWRSLLPLLTAVGVCLAPLMSGLFVVAMRDSSRGLIAGKATLLGFEAGLSGYFDMLLAVYAAGGLLVCGVVTAWVFGREFADRTAVDLLALPVSRSAIVAGKYVVVAVWCVLLSVLMFVVALGVAAALGLSGWSYAAVAGAGLRLAVLCGASILLMTPFGFAASVGRGYLPSIGLVLLAVVLAQALTTVGVGAWFPWAVPALAVGMAGPAAGDVGLIGYLMVLVTAAAGAVFTVAWWRRADHR